MTVIGTRHLTPKSDVFLLYFLLPFWEVFGRYCLTHIHSLNQDIFSECLPCPRHEDVPVNSIDKSPCLKGSFILGKEDKQLMDQYANCQVVEMLWRITKKDKGKEVLDVGTCCYLWYVSLIRAHLSKSHKEGRECAIQPSWGQAFQAEGTVRAGAMRWCVSFLRLL